jgi:hypothetical protein
MAIQWWTVDAVAHLMSHYFDDVPGAQDVDAEALAAHSVAMGACDGCIANFVKATGGTDFADAIERVWDSPEWQALRSGQADHQDERGEG